jgi:acylphosphatase
MLPGMERRAVMFVGRVQGVGFRATAAGVAGRHPVTGWVRNEPDDTVRLEVQGSAAAIDGMLAELRERMGRFIVKEVASAMTADPSEAGFRIRR